MTASVSAPATAKRRSRARRRNEADPLRGPAREPRSARGAGGRQEAGRDGAKGGQVHPQGGRACAGLGRRRRALRQGAVLGRAGARPGDGARTLADVVLFGSFLAWALADRISLTRRTEPPVQGAPPGKANDWIALVGGLLLYGAFLGGVHWWLIGVSPLGVR